MYQQEASWLTRPLSETILNKWDVISGGGGDKTKTKQTNQQQLKKPNQEMTKDKQKTWKAHSLHAHTCTNLNTRFSAEEPILEESLGCRARS